jgi:hypothetical protein
MERRRVNVIEQRGQSEKHYANRPHQPCEPCCGAVTRPTDSSGLLSCPFCHNATLLHYRLLSVTTNVTRSLF